MAKRPTKSEQDVVDMKTMRETIRAEEADKLRAESAARSEAEAERQAELDANNAGYSEVVCVVSNVHTSKGKMVKGGTKNLPNSEAELLADQRKVKLN